MKKKITYNPLKDVFISSLFLCLHIKFIFCKTGLILHLKCFNSIFNNKNMIPYRIITFLNPREGISIPQCVSSDANWGLPSKCFRDDWSIWHDLLSDMGRAGPSLGRRWRGDLEQTDAILIQRGLSEHAHRLVVQRKDQRLLNLETWLWIPVHLLTSWVTLGRWLNFSEPKFSHISRI